jgi:predicted HAD superfamily phosphohydrolase YqeG
VCWGTGMRSGYARRGTLKEALRTADEVGAKTVVLDIEPLVAAWDGSQRALDAGVKRVLRKAVKVSGVVTVCFATNSARRPSGALSRRGVQVRYLTTAFKPFRLAPYDGLPRPGVLIGDQVLTDGLLARRLGYLFIHVTPERGRVPPAPWLLRQLGRPARLLLFRQISRPAVRGGSVGRGMRARRGRRGPGRW